MCEAFAAFFLSVAMSTGIIIIIIIIIMHFLTLFSVSDQQWCEEWADIPGSLLPVPHQLPGGDGQRGGQGPHPRPGYKLVLFRPIIQYLWSISYKITFF